MEEVINGKDNGNGSSIDSAQNWNNQKKRNRNKGFQTVNQ